MTTIIFLSDFIIPILLFLFGILIIEIPYIIYRIQTHYDKTIYQSFTDWIDPQTFPQMMLILSVGVMSILFMIIGTCYLSSSVGTVINNRNNEPILFQQYAATQQTLQDQVKASSKAVNPELMTSIRNYNSNVTRLAEAQNAAPINFSGKYNWSLLPLVDTTSIDPTLTIKNGD